MGYIKKCGDTMDLVKDWVGTKLATLGSSGDIANVVGIEQHKVYQVTAKLIKLVKTKWITAKIVGTKWATVKYSGNKMDHSKSGGDNMGHIKKLGDTLGRVKKWWGQKKK